MRVAIATAVLDRLRGAAVDAPDREICALLTGTRDPLSVTAMLPARNVADAPADCFEADPAVLLAALRAERAGGPALVGCAHSHPHGPAVPSPRDAAAATPGALWLIVGAGAVRAWRARAGGFDEWTIHAAG